MLMDQSDELRKLRNNFIDLSEKPVMTVQKQDLELDKLKQGLDLIFS
jgi:hypothetical protein